MLALLAGVALFAAIASSTRPTGAHAARIGDRPSGPGFRAFGCAGRWAPIQAKVSGFVVGNCPGGARVRGIASDACAPGCVRGVASEGRGWAAVSLPKSLHYKGCGWINMKNRLHDRRAKRLPKNRCHRSQGPDLAFPQSYIKRYSGRRVGRALAPNTKKYHGLYIWGGRFTRGPNRGQEGGAVNYRPRFPSAPNKICRAYANINPSLPGQRVRRSERMWAVHDGWRYLQIRYIARYQVADERGRLRWWVNAHSTHPADRDRPWGFISADCLFQGETPRLRIPARAVRPKPAMPWLALAAPSVKTGGRSKCGFSPIAFHTIIARRRLTCSAAKATLRHLGATRRQNTTACTRPRPARGWSVRTVVRDPSLVITRYSRQGRSFDYQRHLFPGGVSCPISR